VNLIVSDITPNNPSYNSSHLQRVAHIARLIFLNRFFHPDHSATSQILSDLAFDLAKRGRRVIVITSRQRYDAPNIRLVPWDVVRDVEIYRVWTSHFGRSGLIGRAIDYVTFYFSATWLLWRLARTSDVVVAKTDPPMLSVLVGPATRWRGAHLVNWLQDVFPEVASELGVGQGRLSKLAYALLRGLRDRSLKRASCNVVIGDLMARRLRALGVSPARIRVIPNWADGSLIRPIVPDENLMRQEWDLREPFVVGYSGNLGRAHEYQTFLDAIARLESEAKTLGANAASNPLVKWLFIGGGAQYEIFRQEVETRGLTSVLFKPYQPRERLAESLSAADVHLVTLRPELEGLIVPSKFYGVAAAGRPTIFIGDKQGEISRVLAEHGCGISVSEGDGEGLARAILDLASRRNSCADMGARARLCFERNYEKTIALGKWAALLQEVEAGATGAQSIREESLQ
jgi:glycosyltransferase involved in cell wall biosynthesis